MIDTIYTIDEIKNKLAIVLKNTKVKKQFCLAHMLKVWQMKIVILIF